MSYIEDNERQEGDARATGDIGIIGERYDIDSLKRKKAQAKSACTRSRRKLMELMDSDLPSRRQIREALQKIDDAQEVAMEIIGKIAEIYTLQNELKNTQKITKEMEDLEEITTEVTERAQVYLDSRKDEASSIATLDVIRTSARRINSVQVNKEVNTELPSGDNDQLLHGNRNNQIVSNSSESQGSLEDTVRRFGKLNIGELDRQMDDFNTNIDMDKCSGHEANVATRENNDKDLMQMKRKRVRDFIDSHQLEEPYNMVEEQKFEWDKDWYKMSPWCTKIDDNGWEPRKRKLDDSTNICSNIPQILSLKENSQHRLMRNISDAASITKVHQPSEWDLNKQEKYNNEGPEVWKRRADNTKEWIDEEYHKQNDTLGKDMWKQLKRVSIPIFNGNKKNYSNWKAAFMACIDQAPATAEYKLLQLRQYLSGEALNVIQNLGHSAAAYQVAKERLERKFGGQRRQMAIHLEELENLKSVRYGNAKDLEHFADILDITIINLKECGNNSELGDGSLYLRLQKKLPQGMLTQYQRWIHENRRQPSVETLREWVILESEYQTVAYETVLGFQETNKRHDGRTYHASNLGRCKICRMNHGIWMCETFRQMKNQERWDAVKSHDLCFCCLEYGHRIADCKWGKVCNIDGCSRKHNRLLHNGDQDDKSFPTINESKESAMEGEQEALNTTFMATEQENIGFTSLRTIPVIVEHGKTCLRINALLDDGSTQTYINSDIAARLNLQGVIQETQVNMLNGSTKTFETTPVQFNLRSINGAVKKTIEAFTINNVTGDLKVTNWKALNRNWSHLKNIDFPIVSGKKKVDMLIGVDYPDFHVSIKEIRGGPGQPIARLTPLGWTCIGKLTKTNPDWHQNHFTRTYFSCTNGELSRISENIKRFWALEDVSLKEGNKSCEIWNPEEKEALKLVEKSVNYDGKRYEIGIPWKRHPDTLDLNNYKEAERRLHQIEKQLAKKPEIQRMYQETIQQYLDKGYIKQIENKKYGIYLAHFPVVRTDKDTTKTRIVFDASAKKDGVSVNDLIYAGPKLQKDLFNVLIRFRRNAIAVVCDISEMYLQIKVQPKDCKYLQFLWRQMDQSSEPCCYQFQRLVFGLNSAPFEAQYISQKNAELRKDKFPLAFETILESTYMDDSMDSVENNKEAIKLIKELKEVWGKAGMHPRKWLSNSKQVLEEVDLEDRAKQIDMSLDDLPSVKTLGIMWSASSDEFSFCKTNLEENIVLTKRKFLSKISTLFDPLGFLTPFTVRAKILMQEIWVSGSEWDDYLPGDVTEKAKRWFVELEDLSKIKIQRCLRDPSMKAIVDQSFHVFTDASQEAYAAVMLQRSVYGDGSVSISFIASKSKVAPLNAQSIPRLELLGAILGLHLSQAVLKTLGRDIKCFYWCDSMNVLYWIKNPSRRFKPFVANRIGEIHTLTEPNQWRYVNGKENPADIGSRGMSVEKLSECKLWWYGPDFLMEKMTTWPQQKFTIPSDSSLETRNKLVRCMISVQLKLEDKGCSLQFKRFSCWKRLVRVFGWIWRFIQNCRSTKEYRDDGPLTPEEIIDTEAFIIKTSQKMSFQDEYESLHKGNSVARNSKLVSLVPMLDKDGLIRCNGRLKHAEFLPYETKYPIILPRGCHVTKLIVRAYHEDTNHSAGRNHLLSLLSSKYWVISGREVIRECLDQCLICRKKRANPASQLMAALPKFRLKFNIRAFSSIGIDFAGPFFTKQGRGKTRNKRYLCLFTCLSTRAVHLEMTYGLDTTAFLNGFYRMVNRRGVPSEVVSDNGGSFVAANKELKELVSLLDKTRIEERTSVHKIKWYFNPPHSPHFGGIFEIMIKSAKKAVYDQFKSADISDEELLSAFVGAEGLINSRPLTYQSADSKDIPPITPNHFLFGQVGGQFAPQVEDRIYYNVKKRWRHVQLIVQHFWKRWMSELIPTLNQRKKWQSVKRNIEVGEIVLILSADSPRGKWPLGRVVEVIPGDDGFVRVVKVQVGGDVVTRSITRICPLEVNENC